MGLAVRRRGLTSVRGGAPQVLYGVNDRLRQEDVDSPLTEVRPVKKVLLVVVSGDRGLCGGYNGFILKKTVARVRQLEEMGVKVQLVVVGNKARQFFRRRADKYTVAKSFTLGQTPGTKEAQAVADEIFAQFVSGEVDKVELVYTKFVSLIASDPTIQTLLPMAASGEMCDVDGNCVDFAEDEIFRLTSKDGKFNVARDKIDTSSVGSFDASLIFEQDPNQLLDALLPLYMNSTVLRILQVRLRGMHRDAHARGSARVSRVTSSPRPGRARRSPWLRSSRPA